MLISGVTPAMLVTAADLVVAAHDNGAWQLWSIDDQGVSNEAFASVPFEGAPLRAELVAAAGDEIMLLWSDAQRLRAARVDRAGNVLLASTELVMEADLEGWAVSKSPAGYDIVWYTTAGDVQYAAIDDQGQILTGPTQVVADAQQTDFVGLQRTGSGRLMMVRASPFLDVIALDAAGSVESTKRLTLRAYQIDVDVDGDGLFLSLGDTYEGTYNELVFARIDSGGSVVVDERPIPAHKGTLPRSDWHDSEIGVAFQYNRDEGYGTCENWFARLDADLELIGPPAVISNFDGCHLTDSVWVPSLNAYAVLRERAESWGVAVTLVGGD